MAVDTQQRVRAGQAPGSAQMLLVGYDGSEEAEAALRTALDRAGHGDTIAVIHAYPRVSTWMGRPFYDQAVVEAQYNARRILDRAGETASGSPAEVTLEMHEGPPGEVLARIGALRDSDEIIVGSRRLGRVRGALASVSQALLRTASRPVTVVSHRAPEAA